MNAFTVTAACTGCGACLRTCPQRCIRPAGPGAPVPLDVLDGCTGCGECAEVCPVEACVAIAPGGSGFGVGDRRSGLSSFEIKARIETKTATEADGIGGIGTGPRW